MKDITSSLNPTLSRQSGESPVTPTLKTLDDQPNPTPGGWSLKRQIQALGILVGCTLIASAFLGFQIFMMTESSRMRDASTQVTLAIERMIRQYENAARLSADTDNPPPLIKNVQSLQAISLENLADLPGLEGGFYDLSRDQLLGYAYPTYLGSGPKTDIPEAERPAISRLVNQAVTATSQIHEQVEQGFDVILFGSAPLIHNNHAVGAVWVMYRLPGIRNPQWRYYSFSLITMLAMAGLVAGTAWLIARRLDKAIAQVVLSIQTFHSTTVLPISTTRYAELNRVTHAINNLVKTVHVQQARREQLERQLQQADRLAILGRLVAGVAHEVRNPLSSIRLKLQLARRGQIELGKVMSAFDIVEKEVSRLDRLVTRLLTVAKPTSLSCVPTDIGEFVQNRLQNWTPQASELGITVDYTGIGCGNFRAWIDRDRLGQIFDNLMTNAFDALAKTGGTIWVTLVPQEDHMFWLTVSDSGAGIASEAKPHLFEPFFTTRPQGTGLGLFLSAEMARASGGTLIYADGPRTGASFELRIPYRPIEGMGDITEEFTTTGNANSCKH